MQIGVMTGTVAEICQLTAKTVVLRLNQTYNVKKGAKWIKAPGNPVPVWFLEHRAEQLVESVNQGDFLSVSFVIRVQGDKVHLHAVDFEYHGKLAS